MTEEHYILIRFPDFRSTRAARVYRPSERHWWLVRLQWLAPFVADTVCHADALRGQGIDIPLPLRYELRLWKPDLPATAHRWDDVERWCMEREGTVCTAPADPEAHSAYIVEDADTGAEWYECSWEITTPRSVEPTGRGSMDLETAYRVLTEWA